MAERRVQEPPPLEKNPIRVVSPQGSGVLQIADHEKFSTRLGFNIITSATLKYGPLHEIV